MLLTLVAQNLGQGGLRGGDGEPEDRWPLLAERIAAVDPPVDLVLLCEAVDWGRYGHKQLSRAMGDLDLDALPLPPSPSGYPTALLYRRGRLGRWRRWNTDFADQTLHGFGVASFDIGLPALLSVVSVHLDPHDGGKAVQEAKLVATRAYRYGPFAVLGGDTNYPPARGPEPDYAAMRPYNLAARTELDDPDAERPVTPNRRVGWMLDKCGYVDAAWYLHRQTGDDALLRRTADDDRIDRFHVSAPIAPAVTAYRRLDQPAAASDHHGVLIQIDTERIDTTAAWTYR